MFLRVSPMMDKEYAEWVNATPRKIERGLANALGFTFGLMAFNTPSEVGLTVGYSHGLPLIYFSWTWQRPEGRRIVVALNLNCRNQSFWIGDSPVFSRTTACESCEAVIAKSAAATERVEKEIMSQMGFNNPDEPKEDGGAAVGAKLPPTEPTDGGLISWP